MNFLKLSWVNLAAMEQSGTIYDDQSYLDPDFPEILVGLIQISEKEA